MKKWIGDEGPRWPHLAVWAAVGFVFGVLFWNIVLKP